MSSAWGKRMSSAWGKRMSSAWGKRADSDNDEYYNSILRELYHQAHLNKYEHSRYPSNSDGKEIIYNENSNISISVNPLAFEQYLAQHSASNNDDEVASQNMS
jgi:hypothetical protein